MATITRVTPTGWLQDNEPGVTRVTPTGWVQHQPTPATGTTVARLVNGGLVHGGTIVDGRLVR